MLGAVAEFEKATLVAKLAVSRKRERLAAVKCGGRKTLAETNPERCREFKAAFRKCTLSLIELEWAVGNDGLV